MWKKYITVIILAIFLIILDQSSKFVITEHFRYGQSMQIIPVFSIVHIHNTGAAFGFLADHSGWQQWLFLSIAVIVSGILLWVMRRATALESFLYTLIIAGALGNAIDRITRGYVIDFISLHWHDYFYPAFNIADSYIVCAVIALIILNIRRSKTDQPPQDPSV